MIPWYVPFIRDYIRAYVMLKARATSMIIQGVVAAGAVASMLPNSKEIDCMKNIIFKILVLYD